MTRTRTMHWPYDPSRLPPNPTEEQIAAVTADNDLWHLRKERDYLISLTDWWVLPDRTPTQAQLDYRQALRDITDTYTSLDDVVWPVKPE
jgi:hypothetical protein